MTRFSLLFRLLFVVILGVGTLSGCRSTSTPDPQVQNLPKPDVADLLDSLRQRDKEIRNINVVFDAEILENSREQRVQIIAIAEKPDKLYLEIAGPLGMLGMFSCDGQEIRLFNGETRQMEIGPADKAVLSSLIPIEMDPAQLVSVLSVAPTPIEHDAHNLSYDAKAGLWVLTFAHRPSHTMQRFRFAPSTMDLHSVAYLENGTLVARATYLRWKKTPKGRLPELWKIDIPARNVTLNLDRNGEAILNRDYPEQTFRISP